MNQERLQKVMAQAGIASRRGSEKLILAGKVEVNGKVITTLGVKVDPTRDRIRVNGKLIKPSAANVYYVLHKPTNVVSSCYDPQGRPTVLDFLPGVKERIYPVGRLDYDSEGLVFLTNDGDTALVFSHPRYQVPKSYLVQVQGYPNGGAIKRLCQGIKLSDGWTAPAKAKVIERLTGSTLLVLEIHEGKNRQIRRMCDAIGHPVMALKRFRMGPLDLEGLGLGDFRRLKPREIREMLAFVNKAKTVVDSRE